VTATIERIAVGDQFAQVFAQRDGVKRMRVIEVIGAPTPSTPVNYRVIRNDAHPHRVGKTASIRKSELERKYRAL